VPESWWKVQGDGQVHRFEVATTMSICSCLGVNTLISVLGEQWTAVDNFVRTRSWVLLLPLHPPPRSHGRTLNLKDSCPSTHCGYISQVQRHNANHIYDTSHPHYPEVTPQTQATIASLTLSRHPSQTRRSMRGQVQRIRKAVEVRDRSQTRPVPCPLSQGLPC